MADIDKSLAQAPQGIEAMAMDQPDLSIEIENPESVTLDDGSMEITITPGKEVNDEFNANLAEDLDEGQLTELSGDLIGEYDADINSRKDWLTTYVEGLELLGLKVEDRTEPWPGACNVYHPLMTEALVKFQAETMMETFPAAGPVKTQIVGKQTKEREEAAQRVKDDMNYQLTQEMPEYRPEHERSDIKGLRVRYQKTATPSSMSLFLTEIKDLSSFATYTVCGSLCGATEPASHSSKIRVLSTPS